MTRSLAATVLTVLLAVAGPLAASAEQRPTAPVVTSEVAAPVVTSEVAAPDGVLPVDEAAPGAQDDTSATPPARQASILPHRFDDQGSMVHAAMLIGATFVIMGVSVGAFVRVFRRSARLTHPARSSLSGERF